MNILVYCDYADGSFKKNTHELLSYGYKLAQDNSGSLQGVTFGNPSDDEVNVLGKFGAANVTVLESADAVLDNKAISAAVAQEAADADVVLFPNNYVGRAIAPAVAARLVAGIAPNVAGLPVNYSPFVVPKRVFSGKALAEIEINSDKKVLTLIQNSYEIAENSVDVSINKKAVDAVGNTKVTSVDRQTDKVILTDAEIVVSGGRGMKGPENWAPIEELADLLGGATACSRPVSDEGWRPHSEHVGQTGKVVAPNLYFAFGISGAIQHVAGVTSSKCIVAVNKDKDAPIFEVADYGIIGDVNDVVPKIVDAVKAFKG